METNFNSSHQEWVEIKREERLKSLTFISIHMKVEKYFCEGVRGNSDCRGCGAKDVPPDYVRTKTTMSGQCVMLNLLGKSEIATRLQGLRPTLRLYTYQESD